MPKPYPKEFRDEIVRVAQNRETGVRIKDIAADFGITESCLWSWLAQAARDNGDEPGPTSEELAELQADDPLKFGRQPLRRAAMGSVAEAFHAG